MNSNSDTGAVGATAKAIAAPPDEIRSLPAWLCWKFELIPGEVKARKVPYYANGGKRRGVQGRVEDREQLVTFDAAKAAAACRGFDGVGFCPMPEFGITALDFDNCVRDGRVDPLVERMVAGTYAELSPSGTGVRAFVRGQLSNNKDAHGEPFGLEVFSSKGYVTFSGNVLPVTELCESEDVVADASPEILAYCAQRFGRVLSSGEAPASPTAPLGLSPEQMQAALDVLDPNMPRADWLRVGMALHHETQGSDEGLQLWDHWSSAGTTYPGPDDMAYRWGGFGRYTGAQTTAHALVRMANANGAHIETAALEGDVFDVLPDLTAEQEAEQLAVRQQNAARAAEAAIRRAKVLPDEVVNLENASERPQGASNARRHPNPLPAFPQPFPGPMLAAVKETLAASPKPQPALATLAVLVGMAAACSGAYRCSGGMRLNTYGIGVAPTGAGKDQPRKVSVAIAEAAGARVIGKPASGQGLEDALMPRASMLVEVDEVGHMLGALNAKGAPSYLVDLAGNLLKLYSASAGTYHTRVRAMGKGTLPARSIVNPCLSLIGFATPESLGRAVSTTNVADGLLGRMLFAFGDDDVKPRRPKVQFHLPEEVRETGEAIKQAIGHMELTGADGIDIQLTQAAQRELDRLLVELDGLARKGASAFEKSLRVRSYEKLERIAGTLAVWENPAAPVVDVRHVDWAARAVIAADAALVHFAEHHMHEGEVQANAALVLKTIQRIVTGELQPDRGREGDAVRKGYAPRSLVLRRSKLGQPELDRAVLHLQAADEILVAEETVDSARGGARPMRMYRLADGE